MNAELASLTTQSIPDPATLVLSNLARTFAITMCPKKYSIHMGRIQQRIDAVAATHHLDFVLLRAIADLYRTQGRMSVEELASISALSRRSLERQFKAALELSPKRLARLIRFEAVRDQLLRDPLYRLNDLPFEYGYTDQAHFIHDFKGLAAFTPGEFVAIVLKGDTQENNGYCVVSRACPLVDWKFAHE